ncbi:MAG: hypothetical protein EZS28_012980 [Streblomastix strix]|uniref:Uncharacterized protein n=1 Tax=Streblomastix strix TaxID=222440 RepID=A0A5J4WA18_9EUKA|nr:MAG: hypothetical protein EZS28_012980 [Streblomastix strix]
MSVLQVVPYQPAQPWQSNLVREISKYMIFSKSDNVLKPGERMRKLKKHLPPEKNDYLLERGAEERNY